MFQIGQCVVFNPKQIGGVDTERGFVIDVEMRNNQEYVKVFWEKAGHNDGGAWRSYWFILV